MSAAGPVAIDHSLYDLAEVETPGRPNYVVNRPRTVELLVGEGELMRWAPAIRELRHRCGQDDDFTTDPQ